MVFVEMTISIDTKALIFKLIDVKAHLIDRAPRPAYFFNKTADGGAYGYCK